MITEKTLIIKMCIWCRQNDTVLCYLQKRNMMDMNHKQTTTDLQIPDFGQAYMYKECGRLKNVCWF